MSPLLVGLLKRLALWGLVGAAVLVIGPPVLTEFGLLGPSLDEILDGTVRSVETARLYGATEDLPSFEAANRELEAARDLGARGEMRRARHAARRAGAHAIAAQREALARKEAQRGRADAIHDEIDAALNELEDLYDRIERRNPKGAAEPLLSTMKAARQAGAGLILAYEEGNYRKVIVEEESVKTLLRAYREEVAKGGDALETAAPHRSFARPGSGASRRADRR